MEDKNIHVIEEIFSSRISESDRRRFDKDKAYQRFLARTGRAIVPEYRDHSWRIMWRSAAAIAALVIASYFSFQLGGKQQQNVQFADINIETVWGSQVKTYLPDGTLVWLNANSKLTYSQGFGVDDRIVHLNGEGYFEVTHHEKLPFSVQTNELRVSVFGTKFNFRNYADDNEAMISLLEGKVSIGNHVKPSDDIVLEPDQKLFLDKKSGDMHLKKTTASNDAEWTKGYLFFDEELISDIAKDLERNYNVKITIHPDLADMRFYGNFIRKELSIKDILDILTSTGRMKYSMTGKEIMFNPK